MNKLKRALPYLPLLLLLLLLFAWLAARDTSPAAPISLDEVPAYSGDPYVEINGNVPFFTQEDLTVEVFETYSSLDYLNRCGPAYANICQELMPTEKRGEIGMIRPSGWHTVRYDGLVDGNYLYNRCHLIGFQLAGENANEKNLITGTRYMNVEGMLPFEDAVDDYVDDTWNHVLYRVTPIFDGKNLVASGVLMEAQSVEDGGLSFCVYVYNVQPGVTIDYATGESWLSDPPAEEDAPAEPYILNTNTKKFHLPGCPSVADVQPGNRDTAPSRQAALDRGYQPCGRCRP